MKAWYVPCWSGDFRLEADSPTSCVLTVEAPTAEDTRRLSGFLQWAFDQGWLDAPKLPKGVDRVMYKLPVGVEVAGPELVRSAGVDAGWTAIKSTEGKITLHDNVPEIPNNAEAAVSLSPPHRGCPEPEPTRRRASEVLRAFLTPAQERQWLAEGRFRVIGNATGKAYHVYHADEAARRGLSRCLVDVAENLPICIYDATVPAEEQALSLKLAVEHRENWLLAKN